MTKVGIVGKGRLGTLIREAIEAGTFGEFYRENREKLGRRI